MHTSILSFILALIFALSVNAHWKAPTHHNGYLNYTTIPGLFLQDSPTTNASTFNFTASNFGLIPRRYPSDSTWPNPSPGAGKPTQWQRLTHHITSLNTHSPPNVRYALLYLGRHGEGYHNAAEAFYGTPAWNCFWAERDGNGSVVWADAEITPTGAQQALAVNVFWKSLIPEGVPLPQSYYTSPLRRCLETANLTFGGLELPRGREFKPTVKEGFREGISAHTCDRRGTRTAIREAYPGYGIEAGFTEVDELWEKGHAETSGDQDLRSKEVLDEVLGGDGSTFVSVTSHSGEIASLLRVLGHQEFSLSTGAVIPVLVKVTTLKSAPATSTYEAFTSVSTCAMAPTVTAASCNDCSCCK
ncbi:phosphoglycerate mutase family protein [Mytilinidion resinicola]|uniref:Phosphoglycerate mutase family protein n=1 Tax=Mytilinidion resinicola TaxID=574789 RepID=A0A6A6Z0Q1_9PEZI|nr:phosphoglycerate mutase family protein [Mytilinidion resinicola]KAF2814671.1 phosphoglycerate mutase family protein [Mytilinidion resinicola]